MASSRITVRIPAVIHEQMKKEMAEHTTVSVSWIVVRALADRYGIKDTHSELHSKNEGNGGNNAH